MGDGVTDGIDTTPMQIDAQNAGVQEQQGVETTETNTDSLNADQFKSLVDQDGDGQVQMSEAEEIADALGMDVSEVQSIIDSIDANDATPGDGQVSVSDMFNTFDVNGDGTTNGTEATQAASQLGSATSPASGSSETGGSTLGGLYKPKAPEVLKVQE